MIALSQSSMLGQMIGLESLRMHQRNIKNILYSVLSKFLGRWEFQPAVLSFKLISRVYDSGVRYYLRSRIKVVVTIKIQCILAINIHYRLQVKAYVHKMSLYAWFLQVFVVIILTSINTYNICLPGKISSFPCLLKWTGLAASVVLIFYSEQKPGRIC